MKSKLLILIAVIVLFPIIGWAQSDVFEKYSDNPDATYVEIKPQMLQMIAKMGISSDDPDYDVYMSMINSITSFKTLVTSNKEITSDVSKWVTSPSNTLEELIELKEDGSNAKFYVKEGKDAEHVKELFIFVNGVDKLLEAQGVALSNETNSIETVIVSIVGDIDLNQISTLTDKMNIL